MKKTLSKKIQSKASAFTLLELVAVIAVVGVLVVGVLVFSKGIINAVKDFKSKFPSYSFVETTGGALGSEKFWWKFDGNLTDAIAGEAFTDVGGTGPALNYETGIFDSAIKITQTNGYQDYSDFNPTQVSHHPIWEGTPGGDGVADKFVPDGGSFSISFWVKPTYGVGTAHWDSYGVMTFGAAEPVVADVNNRPPFLMRIGYQANTNDELAIRFADVNGGDYNLPVPTSPHENETGWNHLVIVYSDDNTNAGGTEASGNSTLKVYMNNVLLQTFNGSSGSNDFPKRIRWYKPASYQNSIKPNTDSNTMVYNSLFLGMDSHYYKLYYLRNDGNPSVHEVFDGAFDDLRLFEKALTDNEVQTLYQLGEGNI